MYGCMKEMYQVLAFNEYINYKVLEERYNDELVANGYEPINESIGESIAEGFEKIINFLKKIIEKIIHFITVVIPGAIKKLQMPLLVLVNVIIIKKKLIHQECLMKLRQKLMS